MSITSQKVLVYGGTGSQARPTVLKLLERGHQAYILTRNPEKAVDLVAAGAKTVIGDLSDPVSLGAASQGMDAIALLIPAFLANPLEALTCGQSAIDAAKNAGVNLIVWNTSGPMPKTHTGNLMNDLRIDLLAYLKQSGVANIVFEPTTYMENWLGPWTAPSVVMRDQLTYPVLENRPMGWIASDDVGSLVVAAMEHPSLAGNYFRISGVEHPTGPELAQHFSRALGRTITYFAMTPDEMGAVLDNLFGKGTGDAVTAAYRQEQQNPNPPQNYHDMREVLTKLPVQMTSIEEWVGKQAAAFG